MFRVLRDDLLAQQWPTGERLPSERALAERFGVNRVSVRAAVSRLVVLGLVTVRRGDGIRATGVHESASLDLVTHLLDASEEERVPLDTIRDLLELRRMAAAEAVALACERASDDQLADLSRIAGQQAGTMGDSAAFASGDLVFARAVLAAAGNLALQLLLNTVERFYQSRPEIAAAMLAEPTVTLASYHATVALIASRDPERARREVRQILAAFDELTLQRLEDPR
ncbi:MAG: GntR family transcriptional regulator [Myxococcota bacterium]|nr:GntR family transcriptional regulator [Myxococcota bacterium]